VSTPEPFAITYVSPAYELIWGRPRQSILDRPTDWIEAVHPEDRERVYGVLADSQRGNETYMEYRIVRPDGSIRWISNPAYPVRNAEGKLVRVVGIAEDITERMEREKSLREAHEGLNAALAQTKQLASETEELGELVDVLQSCQTLEEAYKVIQDALQTTLSSRAGALCITSPSRNIVEAVAFWGDAPGTDKTFRPDDCWALRRGKPHKVRNCDSPLLCSHVSRAPAGGYLCVPLAAQGETLGVLYIECPPQNPKALPETPGNGLDVLARQAAAVGGRISLAIGNLRLRQVLRSQSIRDPLTGLFNRRFMEETLERELSRATRSEQPVALLMMDIDHFKRFNDTFGHQAGDKLLHALGDFIQERTRGQDVACRYGGEELAVILSGGTLDAAVKRAELLREDLKRLTVEHAGQILERVTLSIGVAAYPVHGTSAEELVRAADRALYRAKEDGRDRVVVR
jgi:diguanylate cyclase (GGDEF)-like protein/PAS domain S-box-containing protein